MTEATFAVLALLVLGWAVTSGLLSRANINGPLLFTASGYRPQTNGKVERFNRTLMKEWAYARPYKSERLRRPALPKWLHIYNHHRAHTALKGQPPATRVTNLSGQYN